MPLSARIHAVLFAALAAALNVPLLFGTLQGIDLCVSLLVAPIVAYYGWLSLRERAIRAEVVLFVLAACGGLGSCIAVALDAPDGQLLRHIASLVMILYCIGFLFAGWHASRCIPWQQRLALLVTPAAMFLIVVAAPHWVWSSRVWITPNEQAQLATTFLGGRLLGAFGVLSLAHLWCMQVALCMLGLCALNDRYLRLLCWAGLAAGLFLMLASESRAAQGLAGGLVMCFIGYNLYRRRPMLIFGIMLASAAAVIAYLPQIPHNGTRLSRTIAVAEKLQEREGGAAEVVTAEEAQFDRLVVFTGRDQLLKAAWADIRANPVFGTGFSGRIRANEPTYAREAVNSSTHIYYLTLLWKGGLLFALPLLILLLLQVKRLCQQRREWLFDRNFFMLVTIGMAFGVLALLWDILMVPSAGALAFLLLGLQTQRSSV